MKRPLSLLALFALLVTLGCGGGGDADSNSGGDGDNGSHHADHDDDSGHPEHGDADDDHAKLAIAKTAYGKLTEGGTAIDLYTLTNSKGTKVEVLNWGATIAGVYVPDKEGKTANLVLHYDDLAGWERNASYFGVVAGRYANRIADGKFTLDDTEFQVTRNEEKGDGQLLHGGTKGFDKRVWKAEEIKGDDMVGVRLTYVSADGEEGFPGELTATVEYTLTEENELRMNYEATTTSPTVVNLTNHCYWNMAGADSGNVLDQLLQINADQYLPVDPATLIPTGELKAVEETPYDFTTPKRIGEGVALVDGIDNCYVVNGKAGELRLVATATDPKSGRTMTIESTEPGVQFYTADHLDGDDKFNGFEKNAGFCLETNHFPDSPNQPDFPSTVLRPDGKYTQTTIHRFGLVKE